MTRCFEQIVGEITIDSACDMLERSHKYGKKFFFDKCLDFILKNANEVLKSHGLKQLCDQCLESVVKADELTADEMTVFNALLLWASSQCSKRKIQGNDKNIRQVLGKLVFHVRYAAMSAAEFTEKVSIRQILTSEEKIKIYQYHHGTGHTLPVHFLTEPRITHRNIGDQIDTCNHTAFEPRRLPDCDDVVSTTKPRDPFLKVTRFQNIKGTWKNNGPDAITFKCSKPIALYGIQVYSSYKGSNGFNLQVSIISQIGYQILKDTYYVDCKEGSRLSDVLFHDPVRIAANQLFTIQTFSKGSPVHYGSDGVTPIYVEDVRFDFIASNKSLNGTDVTIGQIPVLLFRKV